jgi:ATP-dependent Clp protease adaptor protein ClpS
MGHPVLSHADAHMMAAGPPGTRPPGASPWGTSPWVAITLRFAEHGALPLPQAASVTPDRESGGAAVMEKAPERVRKPSPRYKVLLHNDPVNSMEYVVTTLRQVVPSLSEQDAIAVMLEAHNTGIGLVIVCDIEPAEFYCETLKAKGLSSTIEPES